MALEEARRGFDALNAELPSIRNRATQMIGVAGLAASFLGGLALQNSQPIGAWGWVAVGSFAGVLAFSLLILWPWRSYASIYPSQLVIWAEHEGASKSEMTRDLALHIENKYDVNRAILNRLAMFHATTAVLLIAEIAAFIVDLRTS